MIQYLSEKVGLEATLTVLPDAEFEHSVKELQKVLRSYSRNNVLDVYWTRIKPHAAYRRTCPCVHRCPSDRIALILKILTSTSAPKTNSSAFSRKNTCTKSHPSPSTADQAGQDADRPVPCAREQ